MQKSNFVNRSSLLLNLIMALLFIVSASAAATDNSFEDAGEVTAINQATQSFEMNYTQFKVQPGLQVRIDGDSTPLMDILMPGLVMTISGYQSGGQNIVTSAYIHSTGGQ